MGIAASMSPGQLDAVLDAVIEGLIAVDVEARVVLFNKRAGEILRIAPEGALGRPIREVLPTTRLPAVLESRQDELNQLQDVGATTIVTNRVVVRDRAGNVEGAVAVFRDVSEVHSLAARVRSLSELRELAEAIVRCSQEAISVADEHGNTILVNPAYSQLLGLSGEQVLHRPVTVDIAEGESVHLRVLRTRRAIKGARLKVGPLQKEVVVNAAPLFVAGELRGSVGVIHDVSEIRRLSEELASARRQLRQLESRHTFEDLLGESPALARAKELALRAAHTPATVLLTGESGTGKEMFAHAIHHESDRAHGPFIRVNCAAIPEGLLEAALFGYEGGAFTGARTQGRRGHFEEADGGTLFLDEIAEAPLALQAKLLRALQEREVVRVGSSTAVPVDVRVVAATNADLEARVAQGAFREDLFYRLSVMPIRIPSLRERAGDVPVLARALLGRLCAAYGLPPLGIAPEALRALAGWPWRGNVRELENLLGRALIQRRSGATALEAEDFGPPPAAALLPAGAAGSPGGSTGRGGAGGAGASSGDGQAAPGQGTGAAAEPGPAAAPDDARPFAVRKAAWERELLAGALRRAGGNREAAARALGITVRNLYYKLRRHGLR